MIEVGRSRIMDRSKCRERIRRGVVAGRKSNPNKDRSKLLTMQRGSESEKKDVKIIESVTNQRDLGESLVGYETRSGGNHLFIRIGWEKLSIPLDV